MGMQFSPMYQPVSTKTIKADGDLNVSPYDVIAYDGNFDTVEAGEFVGGVGNFTSLELTNGLDGSLIKMPTLGYSGYYTIAVEPVYSSAGSVGCAGTVPIFSSPFPISGKISIKYAGSGGNDLCVLSDSGLTVTNITTTQTEYTVTNALNIYVRYTNSKSSGGGVTFTIGTPSLITA